MAHGGEEFGLRPIRRLCVLLGQLELPRPILHLPLQVLAVLREPPVTLPDLAEHRVEAAGKEADLVVRSNVHHGRVIVRRLDAAHGARERDERPRDRALKPGRDEDADPGRDYGAERRHGEHQHQAMPQVARIANQHHAADDLAAVHDWHGDLGGAGAQQGDGRKRLVFGDRRIVRKPGRRASLRQHVTRFVLNCGVIDAGQLGDAAKGEHGARLVACRGGGSR